MFSYLFIYTSNQSGLFYLHCFLKNESTILVIIFPIYFFLMNIYHINLFLRGLCYWYLLIFMDICLILAIMYPSQCNKFRRLRYSSFGILVLGKSRNAFHLCWRKITNFGQLGHTDIARAVNDCDCLPLIYRNHW